jgi:hypothetical protein
MFLISIKSVIDQTVINPDKASSDIKSPNHKSTAFGKNNPIINQTKPETK